MAAVLKYDPKDVPAFQEQVCKKTCICNGSCIEEGKDNHWFLMCPHYHKWKLGYTSWYEEQLKWQREHPEECEKLHQEQVARAKAWKESKKTTSKKKKDESDTKPRKSRSTKTHKKTSA